MHLSTYDVDDPCAVGTKTIYVIAVNNEGTSAMTNIKVWDSISPKMQFIRAKARTSGGKKIPYRYNEKKRQVFFRPVEILQPGEKITYMIQCKLLEYGSAKNTVHARYNEFDKEIIDEEGTSIYVK